MRQQVEVGVVFKTQIKDKRTLKLTAATTRLVSEYDRYRHELRI